MMKLKDLDQLKQAFKEMKKAQERSMIKALVASTLSQIASRGASLQGELDSLTAELKSQAVSKVRATVEPAMEGQSADAAISQAQALPEPHFANPVQA